MKAEGSVVCKEPFPYVREHITARLINREKHAGMLEKRPYTPMEDLALIYQMKLPSYPGMDAAVAVTNELLKVWGVSAEEVMRAGAENTPGLYPASLRTMAQLLGMEDDSAQTMMVVTNERGAFGAVAVLYPGMEEEIKKCIGDFYVIPSSVHEVLAIPRAAITGQELEKIIRHINATQVLPDEVLSDHAYRLQDGRLVRV